MRASGSNNVRGLWAGLLAVLLAGLLSMAVWGTTLLATVTPPDDVQKAELHLQTADPGGSGTTG
jgi:hypothetical protein